MPSIDTLQPDAAATTRANADTGQPGAAPPPPAAPSGAAAALAAFRDGRSEADRTADLLAFAIAAERGLAPTPDAVERARREADAALGAYSLRHIHNHVEQIRQEAVATHLGRLRQPPGFLALVAANLVALAAAGAFGAWLWANPHLLAAAADMLGAR